MSGAGSPSPRAERAGTLLIDAGNTRVKFGWRDDSAPPGQAVPRTPLQVAFRHEEVPEALLPWLEEAGLRPAPRWVPTWPATTANAPLLPCWRAAAAPWTGYAPAGGCWV